MKVLLCGQITGDRTKNLKQFKDYADRLSIMGDNPINPFDIIDRRRQEKDPLDALTPIGMTNSDWRWLNDVKSLINFLAECDALLLLPGWGFEDAAVILALAAQRLQRKLLIFKDGKLLTLGINFLPDASEATELSEGCVSTAEPDIQSKQLSEADFDEMQHNLLATDEARQWQADSGESDSSEFDTVENQQELDDLIDEAKLSDAGKWLETQFIQDNLFKRGRRP